MRRALLSVILGFTLITTASARNLPASIEALRVADGRIGCTVFSINEREHLWMTAHHCMAGHDAQGGGMAWAERYINWEKVTVYRDFPDMDVTIVRTERQSAPALKLRKGQLREPDQFYPGEAVFVIGHGLGWEGMTKFDGTVVRQSVDVNGDGYEFWAIFSMTAFPGHSGSPVFDEAGHVCSVMQIIFPGLGQASGGATVTDLNRETGVYWQN